MPFTLANEESNNNLKGKTIMNKKDRPENLEVTTLSKHSSHHAKLKKRKNGRFCK